MKLATCFFALTVVALAPNPSAAQDFPETSNLRVAGGLAEACRGMSGMDPLCAAYLIGAIDGITNGQVMEAIGRGGQAITPFHCAPAKLTYGEIAKIFIAEVDADASLTSQPSVVVIAGALRHQFPCQ